GPCAACVHACRDPSGCSWAARGAVQDHNIGSGQFTRAAPRATNTSNITPEDAWASQYRTSYRIVANSPRSLASLMQCVQAETKGRWLQLCPLAIDERNPDKFGAICREFVQLLEAKTQRLRKELPH